MKYCRNFFSQLKIYFTTLMCCTSEFSSYMTMITVWKVSKYGVFSSPYFPVFGMNTEIYSVNLCIHCEYSKIRTTKNSVSGHFSRSGSLNFSLSWAINFSQIQQLLLCWNKYSSSSLMIKFLLKCLFITFLQYSYSLRIALINS